MALSAPGDRAAGRGIGDNTAANHRVAFQIGRALDEGPAMPRGAGKGLSLSDFLPLIF